MRCSGERLRDVRSYDFKSLTFFYHIDVFGYSLVKQSNCLFTLSLFYVYWVSCMVVLTVYHGQTQHYFAGEKVSPLTTIQKYVSKLCFVMK